MKQRMPFIQWWINDWLGDEKVSMCEPATRGILFDWLLNMHQNDRSGIITGTREQLARLGRCTALQVDAALEEIRNTKSADVTFRNGTVTVRNRRMHREHMLRRQATLRQKTHRMKGACHAPVTDIIRVRVNNQSPESDSTCLTNQTQEVGKSEPPAGTLSAMAVGRVAAEIMSNAWGWAYDNCKVKITDFTRASLVSVLKPFCGKATETTIRQAWCEAIRRAHGAAVDNIVKEKPAGYAIACFRELVKENQP